MSVVTRLQALEEKMPAQDMARADFASLLSQLAVLNSNVEALTAAMISHMRQTQDTTQLHSKVGCGKTLASSTPDGKVRKEHPSGSMSPSTKYNDESTRGRGSLPLVYERTRSNARGNSETKSKYNVQEGSPGKKKR